MNFSFSKTLAQQSHSDYSYWNEVYVSSWKRPLAHLNFVNTPFSSNKRPLFQEATLPIYFPLPTSLDVPR